ncbi:nucleotidyl transferase AbiEii/AbiGii toxin family protein [Arthrobacter sp. RAF14]|uniref:nucleotidyl transferase AbiEii/AbiGii toxin family protein n=1 Tax=Arthrobacter sp. RAF14 TaxID=3233051 RepID=UPI003F8F1D94
MSEGYASWTALVTALKAKAQQDLKSGATTKSVHEQLTLARFDRFLSRVFADGGEGWMLKGGSAMLARVPDTRATKDLDLGTDQDLDEAIRDLEQRVRIEFGDHLSFELVRTVDTGRGSNQPGVRLRKAVFVARDAQTGKNLGEVSVDVALTPAPVGTPEVREPATRMELAKELKTSPYRLYPLADHVADKVSGVMTTFGGRPSTRVKDLVDLVVIAKTQRFNARELQKALDARRAASQLPAETTTFQIPATWKSPVGRHEFTRLARTVGVDPDPASAEALVGRMVDPTLSLGPVSEAMAWAPGHGWAGGPEEAASRSLVRGNELPPD